MYQTRSAMERRIRALEPKERQQVKRFWQGAKMQPSQVREVLKTLKEQKILKAGTTPFSILQKAKKNVTKAEKVKEEQIKQTRREKTARFYTQQRLAEEEAKEGISPRSTIEEILKKRREGERGYETPPEKKTDERQIPPPVLKEMMIG